ncbi:MAG: hypothetical protein A4E23_01303 [Methanomethylovorans sp. PtaU1.Bin073]|nr:MAG: hypothetical protein A4E23_01303 [Methanomethylovorans sp. PtaU1.Bin073]
MESDRMSCHTSVRKVYERIKEDGTAMSMMLLRNSMGASTYQYHTYLRINACGNRC